MAHMEQMIVISLQILMFVIFLFFGKYDDTYKSTVYPMFQDIHVMIFIGFGFLMTFLKRYGFSAVGFNFLLGALMLQWSIICQGLFKMDEEWKIAVNIESLVDADVATAAVLISMGAVLGTTTYLQLLLMGVVEIFLYCVNSFIGSTLLMVSDVGGSIFVHIFGAYFGLGVSYSLGRKQSAGSKLESSRYTSDLFAMIGTVFLWIYWPSFNAISLPSQQQHRAIINTYLSLASCCVTAFAISSCVTPYTKFDMVHIQNSTLAGGVAIGTSANLLIQPYGAVLVGILAGTLSVYGYKKLTPVINTRLKIHDTCGVHNLHGMPGILGGLSGAFFASLATVEEYQESFYLIFPARSGGADGRNEGRNSYEQAGFQILFMIITIAFAIFSGCITGISIGLRFFRMKSQQFYNDAPFWKEPEDVFLPPTRVNIRQKSQSQIIFTKSNQDL